jgi:hypothetical protein
MTTTLEYQATLELAELDLLATHAGVRFPFPLRVPSFGRLADERDVLLASAAYALCIRGLATEDGPIGMAGELVTALQEYQGAVDVVVVGARSVDSAVAMVYGGCALVCRQSLRDDHASAVRVTRVPAATLSDGLAGLIPKAAPASAMPITLAPGITGLFPALTGRGQLGVIRRRGATITRLREVSWLDSPQGRVRVDQDDDGWVSVNPLRHSELVRALGEMAADARA